MFISCTMNNNPLLTKSTNQYGAPAFDKIKNESPVLKIEYKEENGEMRSLVFAECSQVEVEALNETQIADYIKTGEGKDKAGSYAVQGIFAAHIKGIRGDYFNIVGLPVAGIYKRLYEIGIDLKTREKIF